MRTIREIIIASTFNSLVRYAALAIPVAVVTGSLVALFLWSLDTVTVFRWHHQLLLFLLPVSGLVIHFLYKLYGKSSERGNDLVIDEIHEPGGGVPLRMAPLVLIATLITHLFGGSAGREGTAVQIGGSMAGAVAKRLKLDKQTTQVILMMGISAGFGAVFGTPFAGAVFALEVLTTGRTNYRVVIPCLISGIVANVVCSAWGIGHTQYQILTITGSIFTGAGLVLLMKVAIAGVGFGLTARLFAFSSHSLKRIVNRYVTLSWMVPVTGGLVIIGLTLLAGTSDYLGLGVTTPDGHGVSIVTAFHTGGVAIWSWLYKLVFTVITLSMGFKGGEVTPLFFIGAALGNTLSVFLGVPPDLFAGLGFIAVFAGAANTPVACTLLGVELFGGSYALHYAIACMGAYYFSGPKGIYTAQRSKFVKF